MLEYIKKNRNAFFIILTLGVTIGVLLSVKMDLLPEIKAVSIGDKSEVAQVTGEVDLRNAFVKVSRDVGPAVVSVITERVHKTSARQFHYSPFGGRGGRSPFKDDFFDDFFKDFFEEIPGREYKQMGMGSGVIINAEGYILTNEHVIADADKITVMLSDGREFDAETRGRDPRRDLAVIKIDSKDLPVAALGNSDLVQTGEWVVAIGNPFGNLVNSPQPTVTTGVVSALHRSLPMGRQNDRIYIDLIQTDAAINPGNSGGPLCDLNGEIIGINVAIFSTTGGYQGVGFAIPINTAKSIISDLIKGEEILYGWLGVHVQEVSQDISDYFGLEKKQGALIAGIVKDGPAEEAGIKSGDIVVSFDGRPVVDLRGLLREVGTRRVGEKVKIGLLRDGKPLTVNVKVGQRPKGASVDTIAPDGKEEPKEEAWRGITVKPITDEIAEQLKIDDAEGVIVEGVENGSPAQDAGIRRGDIIREINRLPIKGVDDFNRAIRGAKGNVLVRTDKGYIVIKE